MKLHVEELEPRLTLDSALGVGLAGLGAVLPSYGPALEASPAPMPVEVASFTLFATAKTEDGSFYLDLNEKTGVVRILSGPWAEGDVLPFFEFRVTESVVLKGGVEGALYVTGVVEYSSNADLVGKPVTVTKDAGSNEVMVTIGTPDDPDGIYDTQILTVQKLVLNPVKPASPVPVDAKVAQLGSVVVVPEQGLITFVQKFDFLEKVEEDDAYLLKEKGQDAKLLFWSNEKGWVVKPLSEA